MNYNLKQLLKNIKYCYHKGNIDINIKGISSFSKDIKKEYVFVAIKNDYNDGNQYIDEAIILGATVIISECDFFLKNRNITYIKAYDSSIMLGDILHSFYGNLSHKIDIIGITGTNGKTSCVQLLYNLFKALGYKCGVISTIGNIYDNTFVSTINTTPDINTINMLIYKMYQHNCKYIFIEISSHAIHQNRIWGIKFKGGVFTNITREHIDYHKSFYNYILTKQKFFSALSKDSFALINRDDKHSFIMIEKSKSKKYTFSCNENADFMSKIIEINMYGMLININGSNIWIKNIGKCSMYNILVVYSIARILKIGNNIDILKNISSLNRIKGRYETISIGNRHIIIDYAHTPDAVKNILLLMKQIKSSDKSKIITVIGCGGNKYIDKRYLIGKTCYELSDYSIFTSDNPNYESTSKIINDMKKYVKNCNRIYTVINRKKAIKKSILISNENDIILILGKGHEKYQLINGIKYYFNEKDIISEYIHLL